MDDNNLIEDKDLLITPLRLCLIFTLLTLASIFVVIGFYINWIIVQYTSSWFSSHQFYVSLIIQLLFVLFVLWFIDIILYYNNKKVETNSYDDKSIFKQALYYFFKNKILTIYIISIMTFSFAMIFVYFNFLTMLDSYGIKRWLLICMIASLVLLALSIFYFVARFYKTNGNNYSVLQYSIIVDSMFFVSLVLSLLLAMGITFIFTDFKYIFSFWAIIYDAPLIIGILILVIVAYIVFINIKRRRV